MRYIAALMVIGLGSTGCVRVDYLEYRGSQKWPTGSAFVRTIKGVEVYEGLPQRPYQVIGLLDVFQSDPFAGAAARNKIMKIVEDRNVQAIIWLSDRLVSSGSLIMDDDVREAASVDTGRSTQPEIVITRVQQYASRTVRKPLRSTLLLIRWASGG